MRKLEIIVLNKEDAKSAQLAGADRLELVTDMSLGGISPNLDIVRSVVESVTIPVNVMVRVRGGNFTYNESEMEQHLNYISELKQLPVNGIVFGSLNLENRVEIEQLESICDAIGDLDLTFHRAIDEDVNCFMENIKQLSGRVTNVLTSGGLQSPIEENTHLLEEANTNQLQILCGGGINLSNYKQVIKATPNCDIHIGSLAYNQGDFTSGINVQMVKQVKDALNQN